MSLRGHGRIDHMRNDLRFDLGGRSRPAVSSVIPFSMGSSPRERGEMRSDAYARVRDGVVEKESALGP